MHKTNKTPKGIKNQPSIKTFKYHQEAPLTKAHGLYNKGEKALVQGKVKFYNVKKMFGFITGDDGKDYFVHVTGLKPGVKVFENDLVSFDVEQSDRGPKAVNVDKLQKDNSRSAKDDTDDDIEDEDD